jgi:hypothetical protein
LRKWFVRWLLRSKSQALAPVSSKCHKFAQAPSEPDYPKCRVQRWNYESACTWDIFLVAAAGEMLDRLRKHLMAKQEYLDDVHVRILRVTEDLRAIQRELNCAAMQAPSDPELMELLSQLPELESLDVLKSALDQMRHFLWFYVQVMTSGAEAEERPRQTESKRPATALVDKYSAATDAALLRYFADAKNRKPN